MASRYRILLRHEQDRTSRRQYRCLQPLRGTELYYRKIERTLEPVEPSQVSPVRRDLRLYQRTERDAALRESLEQHRLWRVSTRAYPVPSETTTHPDTSYQAGDTFWLPYPLLTLEPNKISLYHQLDLVYMFVCIMFAV